MKLMVLDGNSIVNRAFYGIRMLSAPDGTPTNGIYGFITILMKLIKEESPDALCVAFDLPAPTMRHLQYDGYKAKRKAMPDELAVQIPMLKDVLDAMGICHVELPGYEADDLIGAASRRCECENWDCVIVTGDKDSFQLITDKTKVKHVKTRAGQTETVDYDTGRFIEEYGFEPKKMVDLKSLMGDPSDNIPGVAGVGEKTALDLVRRFGSLQKIYENLDGLDVSESLKNKLRSGKEMAEMSYELATIQTDAPVSFEPDNAVWSPNYGPELYELFLRLGFGKFIEKWDLKPGEEKPAGKIKPMPEIAIMGAEELDFLAVRLSSDKFISVLATDGLDALEICDGKNLYTVNWATAGDGYNRFLRRLFSSGTKKVSHNVKDLMRLLDTESLPCEGFIFDTALAAYLLEPTESSYEIGRIALKYLEGGAEGARALYGLYPVLDRKLEELGMTELYYNIEMPLCAVLTDMEKTGFAVDKKALYEFGESLNFGIAALQKSIWEQAGEEFNINSPKQLGTVLFERLMLPAGRKTKTGWSTNVDVLESLTGKHPIIRDILDYRQLTKLKSTYVDGLLKVIGPDGRIHTSFQMTVTATGRLSSTEPNLQNIPVRSELGSGIRKMFVSAPGKILVDADYNQIEMRLLAHISGDRLMREAFISGEDIHSVTASQVFNVPTDQVTPLQRSRAKAVNFGIVYGISDFSLAQDIGVYRSEAKDYIEAYFSKYSGVRNYMKNVVEQAKKDEYVSTLFGRRRWLPELKSSNYNIRSFGERVALNMPIQGTAADIIKIAMIKVHRRLSDAGMEAKLILQVHDELIVECPENEAEEVARVLTEEMQGAVSYSVPLEAEAHSGRSWYEAK
jgi:DNA polymerase-1